MIFIYYYLMWPRNGPRRVPYVELNANYIAQAPPNFKLAVFFGVFLRLDWELDAAAR